MKKRTTTTAWRKAALAATSFCAAIMVMEIVFRVAGIQAKYYRPHTHELIREDDGPQLPAAEGFFPLANHRTVYHSDPRNYFGDNTAVDHRFNSAGWRDVEHTIVKPPGTYRILGLGDSYLMGQGVHAEDVFFTRLGKLLNHAHLPVRVETINTGISGNNSAVELQLLEHRGLAYDPDLVVVNFVPNDVETDLSTDKPLIEFYRNYTSITQKSDWLSEYSYLWSWMRQRILLEVVARQYIKDCVASFNRDSKKWHDCRVALRGIVEKCRSHHVPVMLAVFPFYHELNGDYPFQPIHDRVDAFCLDNNVPVLDLREVYCDYSGPELWVHPTDQHPNELAHRLAAEALAEFILARRDTFQIGHRPSPAHDMSEEPRLQGLARITQLHGIMSPTGEFVSFEGVPLADGDLRLVEPYWVAIPELSSISLRDTDITDASVSMLCSKDSWRGIDLSFTTVTSTGVSQLSTMSQLEQLGLENTNIDDQAVRSFAEHPSLGVLNLAGNDLSNDAIDHLLSMSKLETLVVSRTKINKNGVRRLASMPNLKTLVVARQQLSTADRQAIGEKRSDLTIVIQPAPMEHR